LSRHSCVRQGSVSSCLIFNTNAERSVVSSGT
jgi:hypothetical protein